MTVLDFERNSYNADNGVNGSSVETASIITLY